MILIMAKLSLKINLNLAMEIVKILSPNNPIDYLIKMIDEIPNFKAIKNKKMLIYFYSQILVSFNQSINDQSLVNMTSKLLNVVKNFMVLILEDIMDLIKMKKICHMQLIIIIN